MPAKKEQVDCTNDVQSPTEQQPTKKMTFLDRVLSVIEDPSAFFVLLPSIKPYSFFSGHSAVFKLILVLCTLSASISTIQAQDTDSDGVPDALDFCISAGGIVNGLGCPFPVICDTIETTTISFDTSGMNSEIGYLTVFVLADSMGVIVDTSSTPEFTNVMAGKYMVTALDYDDDGSLANFAAGDTLDDVTANCFQWADALTYRICPAEICNNAIDDDEDGLTDCEDPDCSANYYAVAVSSEANVSNSANAIGIVDNSTADITADIGEMILDLGQVIPQGTDITLHLKYHVISGGSIPVADVDGSISSSGPFTDLVTYGSLTLSIATYTYTVNQIGGIQYIRIKSRALSGNPNNQFVDLDAIVPPVVSLTLPDIEECVSSSTLALSGGSPGGGAYSGLGVTGANFEASTAGVGVHTITYTFTDVNGCTKTATDDITVYELPTITLTTLLGPSTPGGSDGSIEITMSDGSGSYTYNWSNGPTSEDISGLSSGTYTVTATDTNGCQKVRNFEVVDAATNTVTGTVFEDFNADGILNGADTGPADVTVRLYNDNNQDGLVDGGDTQIQTTATIAGGSYSFQIQNNYTTSYDGQVSQSSDDARDGNIINILLGLSDKWIGVRFQNISIPAGATITSAYVEFTCKTGNASNPSSVSIRAHDTANPSTFVSAGSDVSSRAGTTANVPWVFGAWSKDITYQSPDITSLIQELYTSYGPYTSGDMAFILEPTGTAGRDAFAFENSTSEMSRLVINYTLPGTYYHVVDVDVSTLPVGATLTTDNVEAATFTASGQTDTGNDFGFELPQGQIGNQVWWDMNENGIKNVEETGLQGVTVGLFDTTNVLLATTITQSGGFYTFNNLETGAYVVRFEPQDGFIATTYQTGSDGTVDSDITFANETAVINLGLDEVLDSIDAGFLSCSNIAYNAAVSSEAADEIHFFNYFTNAEEDELTGTANDPQDIKLGPDSKLYIADKSNNRILIVDKDTRTLDTTITDANLNDPEGLVFGPDGLLYVSNKGGNNVLRYDPADYSFVDIFLDATDGISEPGQGIEFDFSGALYVTSNKNVIKKYNGTNGAFISDFITTTGGAPPEIGDFLIHSDSVFYVTNMGTDLVARYDKDGDYIDDFITAGAGGLIAPTGLAWGPDNNLYVNSSGDNQVKRYSGTTGGFIENYYFANGMNLPQGITFFPDGDCCAASPPIVDTTMMEMFDSASYIINMGIVPQTTANGLLPYGMVYELIYSRIPVKWVINPTKIKDGIDFSHNGVDYRGGPFIIPYGYNPVLVDSLITKWEARGVIGDRTISSINVPVRRTIDYGIHWTLDQDNGSIAEQFLIDAMIPNSAYDWSLPNDLDCCSSIFVMPHAEPGWNSHSGVYNWNKPVCDGGCGGALWAGCRSGSYVENSMNPLNPTQRMNFLMEDPIAPETDPAVDHGAHDNGSTPPDYLYDLPSHPIMQFMGLLDDATQGGSEQIYLPTNAWRPTTNIAVWDDSHADVPSLSPGDAGVLVFGPAYGDEKRGMVNYLGGHDIGGSGEKEIAAQRSFFNFSILSAGNTALSLSATVPDTMIIGLSYELSAIGTGGNGNINYQWTTDCNGSFLDPSAATTTFTPDFVYEPTNCRITIIIQDACFVRSSFFTAEFVIQPNPVPPTAIDDFENTEKNVNVTVGVMQNDYDLNFDIDTSSLHTTGVRPPSNGTTVVNNVTGEITYQPDLDYIGIDTFEYVICDLTALCDTAQVVINITCSTAPGTNIIEGIVFEDMDLSADFNAGDVRTENAKIWLYEDTNQNGIIDIGETAVDSTLSLVDGSYNFTVTPNFYISDSIDRRIIQTSDDALQKNNGSMESLSSSEIKFKDSPTYNGFRFQNINIPSGSIITDAYIEMVGRDDKTGITNTVWYGHDTISSPTFVQTDADISSRAATANSVLWSIPDVEKDSLYQTPDLSAVVQEIIDLPNWDNSSHTMTIIGSVPIDVDEKKFKPYDHTAQEAPMLVIKFQRPAAIVYQYIVEVDSSNLSPFPVMTTPSQDIAVFTFTGQTDCDNNFGFQDICATVTDGGLITGDEALCGAYDPALISNTAFPGGTWDSLDYKWQYSTVANTGPWTDISNTDTMAYNPDSIFITTYYRRLVRHSGCITFGYSSNVITKIVYPIPAVSLSLPDTEECANSSTLVLSGGSPLGGIYTGSGVSGTNFDASAAGVGTHIITYTYTDGNACVNTAIDSIRVDTIPIISLTLPDTDECVNSTTLALSGGSPLGGTYSGPGVSGTNFDASAAGVGTHTITYAFTDGNGCTNTATDDITVTALPTVSLVLADTDECVSSTVLALNGGSPIGGSYSGTGVSGGNFDASTAGVGTHTITYTYTDGNGCTDTATDDIIVRALPSVSLTLGDTEECVSSTTLALSGGSPVGGSYSGTGVSGGNFDASTAGVGTHTITYSYTDGNGCTDMASDDITVRALPSVSLTLAVTDECLSSTTLALSGGSPVGGTYSGTGVSGTNFDASAAGVGTHTITYTYTDGNGCTDTATENITVSALPLISSVSSTNPTTCSGNDGTITVTAAGGSGSLEYRINGGSWQSSNVFAGLGVGSYSIDVQNDNGTCIVSYTANPVDLTNPSSPTAEINLPAATCPGTAASFTATDAGVGATYTWDFGANATPATATGIGPHNVTYSTCGTSNITLDVVLGGCNASDAETFTATDIVAPSADPLPALGPFNCHADVPAADINDVINETDNCGGVVTVAYVGDNITTGCATTVIRTYRLTDICGNQADITQNISVDMSGINTGALTIDADTVCLSLAMTGTISATPDGSAVVPCNYNRLYLLTTGASSVIMDTSSTPDFLLTGPGDFAIHTFIYDSLSTSINYFDTSSINFGTTQLATLETLIEQGGGSVCGALDMTGAAAEAMVCSADIGDFVWVDDNEDGIQDGGEPGIEGVTVSLYDNTNTLINTTTTAADGSYLFSAIIAGTYYLVFDASTNTAGITVYKGTLQNIGSPITDSDLNPATGRSPLFLFDPVLGDVFTLDAGFILSCPPSQRAGVNVIRK